MILKHNKKRIIILRHADWDEESQGVTNQGKANVKTLKQFLPKFSMVIASPEQRAEETAFLLTGLTPVLDARASVINTTPEQIKAVQEMRSELGISTLEAILNFPGLEIVVTQKGQELIDLLDEVFHKLTDGQVALVVSHDGVIVSAEKQLKNESLRGHYHSYKELEGIVIDEAMKVERYSPPKNPEIIAVNGKIVKSS